MTTESTRSGARIVSTLAWIFAGGIVLAQTPQAPPPTWGAPGTPVTTSAPRLAPTKPTTPTTAGMTALPAGAYTLTVIFPTGTTNYGVTVTRDGARIALQLPSNTTLNGSVAVGGAVTLAGTGAELHLSGTASNNTASGQAKAGTPAHPITGTFTLGQTDNWSNALPH